MCCASTCFLKWAPLASPPQGNHFCLLSSSEIATAANPHNAIGSFYILNALRDPTFFIYPGSEPSLCGWGMILQQMELNPGYVGGGQTPHPLGFKDLRRFTFGCSPPRSGWAAGQGNTAGLKPRAFCVNPNTLCLKKKRVPVASFFSCTLAWDCLHVGRKWWTMTGLHPPYIYIYIYFSCGVCDHVVQWRLAYPPTRISPDSTTSQQDGNTTLSRLNRNCYSQPEHLA